MNQWPRSRKVVIGFDGGRQSRDALHLGNLMADLLGAEMVVVCALGPEIEFDVWAATHFGKVFDQARREVPGCDFAVRGLRDVSAPAGLSDVAAEEEADLIAIGSTHRGSLGRMVPGGVGERLLSRAPCPVAVAPHGFADHAHFGCGLIGAAVDGSGESKMALEVAGELAARLDLKLRVITVTPESAAGEQIMRILVRDRIEEIQRGVEAALPASLELEEVVDEGKPAAVLARHGVDLDLLVMGSRGYGVLGRMLVGGVSAEVTRSAPCPVLVVPPAASRRRDPEHVHPQWV